MILSCNCIYGCEAQTTFGNKYLNLEKSIVMPNVKGRIDHLDVNLKDQLVYVAALGNNTLEVADLRSGKIMHSISGLDEPQGVGYIPQYNEIFVANAGNGDCYFYNAKSFEKTATIHLSSDADDVRYDSVDKKIYVGYGEGGIAVIDAETHKQIADITLPAHPESFQIDKKMGLLFVNVPKSNIVGVIDLKQAKLLNKWQRDSPSANFPMAIDTNNARVFVGYRHAPRLIVYDAKTGSEVSSNEMTGDADDLYYDQKTKEIIISGGDGYISIFKQQDSNTYGQIANISTSKGARTSLLIPS